MKYRILSALLCAAMLLSSCGKQPEASPSSQAQTPVKEAGQTQPSAQTPPAEAPAEEAPSVTGTWRAVNQLNAKGDVRYLYLILQEDGYAAYWYTDPLTADNLIQAFYEGTWEKTSAAEALPAEIRLDLQCSGGKLLSAAGSLPGLTGDYRLEWSPNDDSGDTLVVSHIGGDPMLGGMETAWADFCRIDLKGSTADPLPAERDYSDVELSEIREFLLSPGVNGMIGQNFESIAGGELSLREIVYQLDSGVDREELLAAISDGEPETDVSAISSTDLDDLLIRTTGYGLADCLWHFDADYCVIPDAFYVWHGDTNFVPYDVELLSTDGVIKVRCYPLYTYPETPILVTLVKNPLDGFRIVSAVPDESENAFTAYAQFLLDNYAGDERQRFAAVDIDGDAIPELAVSAGEWHAACVELYRYDEQTGAVAEVGSYGEYGSMSYAPGQNLFLSYYFGMGYEYLGYNRLENGAAVSLCDTERDYNKDIRYVNQQEVSEEEYDKVLAQYESGLEFTSVSWSEMTPMADLGNDPAMVRHELLSGWTALKTAA